MPNNRVIGQKVLLFQSQRFVNDTLRMYNFDCITDTIVEVIPTCNTYTVLTVHLL